MYWRTTPKRLMDVAELAFAEGFAEVNVRKGSCVAEFPPLADSHVEGRMGCGGLMALPKTNVVPGER